MNIVKELRIRAGLGQKEVAAAASVARPTVSEWEHQKKDPSGERLDRLAELFGVDKMEILGYPARPRDAIPYSPGRMVRVIGSVRCGVGGLALEEPDGYEPADVENPDEYFILHAVGDSMEPEIHPGDSVLVHLQDDVESGSLAIVIVNGEEGTLKKVIKEPGRIILQAFNPVYPPRMFVGEECAVLRIAGKVVKTTRAW